MLKLLVEGDKLKVKPNAEERNFIIAMENNEKITDVEAYKINLIVAKCFSNLFFCVF